MSDIKLKGLGKLDMLQFKNLGTDRNKVINSSSSNDIPTNFAVNEIAELLHPKIQHVIVDNIINESYDVKTFVLVPDASRGTDKLAPFRAGQYVLLTIKIDDGIYKRPYTISCSPKHDYYTITVKRVEDGIVSNCLLDNVSIGDSLNISGPHGNFYYQKLRDANYVIAIAGGIGITPFISMADAIYDQVEDFSLTTLYGARTKDDLIFKEKLENITCKIPNVNVLYILSEEDDNEYESGFITKDIINRYLEEENSFFVCGPISMYSFINNELRDYNLPNKYVRCDDFLGIVDVNDYCDYTLTIIYNDKEINVKCNSHKTLMSAIEESGNMIPTECHVGVCGYCRSKLISGKVKVISENMRSADLKYNYIHPCATYPLSDVTIRVSK